MSARSIATRLPSLRLGIRSPAHRRSFSSPTPPRPRTAIVTGGARGIGKAIALRLARDGYDITINDVPSAQALIDSTVGSIRALGRRAHGHAADVSDPVQVDGLIDSSVATLGPLDTMVANAGIAQVKALLDLTPEDFARMFAVNVAGVHYCYQAAARQLISQRGGNKGDGGGGGGGKIIGAASIVAFKPFALLGHYSASKWAVRGLTQVYAMELARHGITVNAYAPGIVDTAMWELIDQGLARDKDKEERQKIKKGDMMRKYSNELIALGRTSEPEDVAKLVSFLAGPDSGYITGQTYIVDGGIIYT